MDEDRPYQTEGARFLADRTRALLAFDTRLGKTRTALRAAQLVQARRILVLAPAIGRVAWQIEAPKCTDLPTVVVGPGDRPPLSPMPYAGALLLVLAYDTLSNDRHGWREYLSRHEWDLLILDECQYLKSANSNRTVAVYGHLIQHVHRVWCLSATPTPNHAGEMWPHVKALWPDVLPVGVTTRHEFEDRYCRVDETPYGRRIKGSQRQTELRQLLAPYVLRKRKSDVIQDMPRVAHNLIPLDLPPGELTEDEWTHATAELDKLLSEPANAESMSILRELGEAKAPAGIKWVTEQLENRTIDKLVLFGWHRSVLRALYEGLADFEPAYLDGSTAARDKFAAVQRFQVNPNCRVFIGQIKAAGTAIALDAADDCAILEPSWVPMDNYQAASRIENVSRRKPVTVSWLYAPDTLDERVMATLRAKTRELSALWD